jgi:hypothetical protein
VGGVNVSSRVLASSDDAEEAAVSGCSVNVSTVDLLSPDLELVNDCYDRVIGMRFTNLPGVAD